MVSKIETIRLTLAFGLQTLVGTRLDPPPTDGDAMAVSPRADAETEIGAFWGLDFTSYDDIFGVN